MSKRENAYYLLSLGCSKNTVDSESMAALLEDAGMRGTDSASRAPGARAVWPAMLPLATSTSASPPRSASAAEPVPPPPQVPLGNTGITMSRVGQGTLPYFFYRLDELVN